MPPARPSRSTYKTVLLRNSPMSQKAIILDLDNTLIKTYGKMKEFTQLGIKNHLDIVERCYILDFYNGENSRHPQSHRWGIKRPHLEAFLKYIFKNFDIVIVWSAGGEEYVNALVKAIFTNRPPHYIFHSGHCLRMGDDLTKPIALLFKHRPELANRIDENHIVMIDDREKNYLYNKGLGLVISAYDPDLTLESMREDDDGLLEAMKYIQNRIDLMDRYDRMRMLRA